MKTRYQLHVERWSDCHECELSDGRKRVVLARGRLPCDVLFVGEAPGESEDVIGQPFVGPAGKLLDQIVTEASRSFYDATKLRIAFTNLVGCFPKAEKATKNHAPPNECVKSCAPRLRELIALAEPQWIVCVGKLAETWVEKYQKQYGCADVPRTSITHPAAILRADPVTRDAEIRRCVARLSETFERLNPF